MKKILAIILFAALLIEVLAAKASFAYDYNHELWKDTLSPSEISVFFYRVHAGDERSLQAEMLKSGPEAEDGSRHFAVLNWRIEWNWPKESGRPAYSLAQVRSILKMTLPLPVSESIRKNENWQSFHNRMVIHELQHALHAKEAASKINNVIKNYPSDTGASVVNKEVNKLIVSARRRDISYDKNTKHGKTEGIVLTAH